MIFIVTCWKSKFSHSLMTLRWRKALSIKMERKHTTVCENKKRWTLVSVVDGLAEKDPHHGPIGAQIWLSDFFSCEQVKNEVYSEQNWDLNHLRECNFNLPRNACQHLEGKKLIAFGPEPRHLMAHILSCSK